MADVAISSLETIGIIVSFKSCTYIWYIAPFIHCYVEFKNFPCSCKSMVYET